MTKSIETSQDRARASFLAAIKTYAPGVLQSFSKDVLPPYINLVLNASLDENARLIAFSSLPETLSNRIHCGNSLKEQFETLPIEYHLSHRFELEFCRWAVNWNLIDEWLLYEGLQTLDLWYKYEQAKGRVCEGEWGDATCTWANAVQLPGGNYLPSFKLIFAPFNPYIDTWPSYRKKVEEAFKDQLEEYRESAIALRPIPKIRESDAEHFYCWLVQFQVLKLEPRDIEGLESKTEKYYSKSHIVGTIKELAKAIGLTLRESKRGRPKRL